MLRVEFAGEEPPWEQPIALCGREITGVLVDGERYERVRECEITRISNTRDIRECSECGKHLYLSHPHARGNLKYCPHCGARVKGGAE
jgi:rRNA maturation protein Nop10